MKGIQLNKTTGFHGLVCLLGVLTCSPAWSATQIADTQNTNDVQTITHGMSLARSCEQALLVLDDRYDVPPPKNDAFICMAYLNGIMAATQHANERAKLEFALATKGQGNQADFNLYCFDWQRSFQHIAAIVLTFAQKNPAYLERPANEMVMRALQTAFPCR